MAERRSLIEMPLRHGIPQWYPDDPGLKWEPWHRFLDKACKGSYKASEMLRLAGLALAARAAPPNNAENLQIDHLQQLLSDALPCPAPFQSRQAFQESLFVSGHLPEDRALADQALCRDTAAKFGERRLHPSEVVHDAVRHCWLHWSGREFARLWSHTAWDPDANAIEVVSAMVLLLFAWANLDERT
jgi:hypothetical protein